MENISEIVYSIEMFLGQGSSVNIHRVSKNMIDITAKSKKFINLPGVKRRELIEEWNNSLEKKFQLGLLSLYTPDESGILDINFIDENKYEGVKPTSWIELVNWANNHKKIDKKNNNRKVISFYSYKGGVGRTTALVHVAWTLAKRGKRVVIIDLDLEAPSLHKAVELEIKPHFGLIDYLYERINILNDENPIIGVSDIIGKVTVPKGNMFLIPAGYVDMDYISKVDDLRNLSVYDQELWDGLINEITNQLEPDIIIVDSRTGINVWGALSVLTISDDVVLFMNPNSQNSEGVATILSLLNKINILPYVVLSPVPGGKIGKEKALKEWSKVNDSLKSILQLEGNSNKSSIKSDIDGDEDFEEAIDENDEPIMIPYTTDIALTDEYPYKPLISIYDEITNRLDDESDKYKLISLLSGHERWKVIESLHFSPVDASREEDSLIELFQKTADFERFLDNMTVLIKGKKGTGKTQLYWSLLKHQEVMEKISGGRLERVIPISGHGKFSGHPIRDDFSFIYEQLNKNNVSWESFWRAYALYRINSLPKMVIPRTNKYKPIRELIKGPSKSTNWTHDHTKMILKLTLDPDLRLITRDILKHFDDTIGNNSNICWLLYDDLDQDIQEYSEIQNKAISGLFSFALTLDNLGIKHIRTKIFLRTDIWHRLNFTNKSHFIGRDVELKWSREDFVRLALRQAKRSDLFSEIVSKFAPVLDIDQASEDIIGKALELLWGINREKGKNSKKVSRWVYDRLTDASGSTFPRALIVLLQAAREKELEYQKMTYVQSPTDRLLRTQSLTEGFKKASKSRCDELRQEYKDLDDMGFFQFLSNISQITELDPLENWWNINAKTKFDIFNDFLEQIKQMGLASEYDLKRWKFADIYVHGFKMSRSGKI